MCPRRPKFTLSYACIFKDFIEDNFESKLKEFENQSFSRLLGLPYEDPSFWHDMSFVSFYYGDYESSFLMSEKALVYGCDNGELRLLRLASFNELGKNKSSYYRDLIGNYHIQEQGSRLFKIYLEDSRYLDIAMFQNHHRLARDFLEFASQLYYDVRYLGSDPYIAMENLFKFFYINELYAEALVIIKEILKHKVTARNLHRKLDMLLLAMFYEEAYGTYRYLIEIFPDYFDNISLSKRDYIERFTKEGLIRG